MHIDVVLTAELNIDLLTLSLQYEVFKHRLSQNLPDVSPPVSNKVNEALCCIGRGDDIDMAFWWHYETCLISPYCVVTASNHRSSLA